MLLSHLKFDTSPTEDSGVGGYTWNAYSDLPTITAKDGRSCAYFNGTTSGLISTKPYFPNIDAYKDDWMVSCNVNFTITSRMFIISKWDFNSSRSLTPFWISEDRCKFQIFMAGNGIIPTNQWNLISAVHTNKNIYLYINNVLADTIPETRINATSLNSIDPFTIGLVCGKEDKFNGYMSDFRIYKDEISIPVSRSELFDDSDKNYYGMKA